MSKGLLLFIAIATAAVTSPVLGQGRPTKAEINRLIAQEAAQIKADMAMPNKIRPGLGDDPGEPETTPLSLPPGLVIDGPIKGIDFDEGECKDRDLSIGSGGAVKACLAVCANPEGAEWVQHTAANGEKFWQLERGLILISGYQEGQNGILVEQVRITDPVPPCGAGGSDEEEDDEEERRRKFIIQLNLYCLNEKLGPSSEGQPYRIGGITADSDLQELLAILATKKIETEEHKTIVAGAVYAITEKNGLTSEVRRKLDTLPKV